MANIKHDIKLSPEKQLVAIVKYSVKLLSVVKQFLATEHEKRRGLNTQLNKSSTNATWRNSCNSKSPKKS